MSDKPIETYLTKQEGLMLEFIRRTLQSETKVALLEIAVQEANSRTDEISDQHKTCTTALDQALNGLKAATMERDSFKDKVNGLEKALNESIINYTGAKSRVEDLSEKLKTAQLNLDTLKENYSKVLDELKSLQTLNQVKLVKDKKSLKKSSSAETEWVDGK